MIKLTFMDFWNQIQFFARILFIMPMYTYGLYTLKYLDAWRLLPVWIQSLIGMAGMLICINLVFGDTLKSLSEVKEDDKVY
jgi:hypothetical protein